MSNYSGVLRKHRERTDKLLEGDQVKEFDNFLRALVTDSELSKFLESRSASVNVLGQGICDYIIDLNCNKQLKVTDSRQPGDYAIYELQNADGATDSLKEWHSKYFAGSISFFCTGGNLHIVGMPLAANYHRFVNIDVDEVKEQFKKNLEKIAEER